MLHLLQPTDPTWVDAAAADLGALLSDHAHCELKAAQSALAIVGRFADDAPEMVEPLCDLAREETEHFRQVYAHLRSGSVARNEEDEAEPSLPGLGKPEPDAYVNALRKAARADGPTAPILLDRLIVSALIEARSCESFKLMAEHLPNPELQTFYRGLMESEARHFSLFRGLAEQRFGADARRRLEKLAEREAAIAEQLPLGPTVHG
jgi:tRNA-(ms[2]io[6]A)-hydroxylase